MKLVDLTHVFSIHTPGWVGYPSPKLSYFQRHATNGIVSQYLETPLHAGTHFDGQMHIVSGGSDSRPLRRDGGLVSHHAQAGHRPYGSHERGHRRLPHGLASLLQRTA